MKTDAIIRVKGLSGGYGAAAVVKGVSFDVRRGAFLGIIGPNGSGKSTLLRLMTRVLKPQKGVVELGGENIAGMNSKSFARKVAFVPQDTAIHFDFSVREIVLMGRIPHLGRLQQETKNDLAIAEEALRATDTLHIQEKSIDGLSAGERQRAVVAKALAQEPAVLFLDEPTSHLDIGHQIAMLDLLRRLNRSRGLTIIIVLHDLNLAAAYCDRLVMVSGGAVYTEGSPEEVLTYEHIEKVYKTVVVVGKNPLSSKPNIVPVPEDELCRRR